MFTGIIQEVGRVRAVRTDRGNRLITVDAELAAGLAVGESIAVDGCCLTVTERAERRFTAEAVGPTQARTTLAGLRAGARVNLERALAAGARLGGHFVQGHVDEVGTVRRVERCAGYHRLVVRVSPDARESLIERGSVAVDGVSLTVADIGPAEFSVNVIPHTWQETHLADRRAGDRVNIEYDMLVKAARRPRGPVPGADAAPA